MRGTMNIGAKIKVLRKERHLSQAALAERSGVSQPAIKKIEAGDTKKSRFLPDIARALGVTVTDLEDNSKDPHNKPITAAQPITGERDLPVYGATEGGDGSVILSVDAVDYVRRPAPLANVRDGYGIIVTGDSMRPEFRPGDIALVHPHLPPVSGEACVFYADDHGTVRATIKVFVRATETAWHVEQWNPPKKLTLPRREWQKCHRVVGKYSSR